MGQWVCEGTPRRIMTCILREYRVREEKELGVGFDHLDPRYGWQTFSVKGQAINVLRFVCHYYLPLLL